MEKARLVPPLPPLYLQQMSESLHFIPYTDDPLAYLARRLITEQAQALPRLEQVQVLLPDPQAAPRLRRLLLAEAATQGYQALLGPQILGWQQWLDGMDSGPLAVVSAQRRELILVEALRQHPDLFGEGNLWALADSLLSLFDELSQHQIRLPEDPQAFLQQLERGYGLSAHRPHPALEREAHLVHTLWQAWHSELQQRGLIDRHSRRLLQLANSQDQPLDSPCYLLAPACLPAAERQWLAAMRQQPGLRVIIQAQRSSHSPPSRDYHPEYPLQQLAETLHCAIPPTPEQDGYSQLLDAIYSPDARHDTPLLERARAFANRYPDSPCRGRLRLFAAAGNEEEAQALALQVRRWLLEGREQIGIVTENRKLARRLRALLERAGIPLQDAAGWALSTTSAAAVLERWLQCVEEDFPHVALLDLLKSPFAVPTEQRDAHLTTVYRLQHDLIEHEQIGSGMTRYQQQRQRRAQRLANELSEDLAARLAGVAELLQGLADAAAPLQALAQGGPQAATQLLDALLVSLEQLGLRTQLEQDAAGQRLLDEMQQMRQAAAAEGLSLDWLSFRGWLGRTWERFHFQPPSNGLSVALMGLGQTPFQHFDALAIGGLEREFLPGALPNTPFFNDAVRQSLQLPGADARLAERFQHFRRLLEAAPQLLLSYRHQEGDEAIRPSPWLEALQVFHQLAWGDSCADQALRALLQHPASQVTAETPLPAPMQMPSPSLPANLLPQRYSASAYQQLLNCPYQFFAARGLQLAPPEAIKEALEKSDYGERVHRALQAFHRPLAGLPGPFSGQLHNTRREEAIALLDRISVAVFAEDLEDNFLHRAWLQRWQAQIPAYIDWQIEREQDWQVAGVEQQREYSPNGRLHLHGRLDRIDSNGAQLAIIDYKTGAMPSEEEVLRGEAVQLPFYALLSQNDPQPVGEVAYLALDEDKGVRQKLRLDDDALYTLSQAIARRLENLDEAMQHGARLPAWGDENTCEYCQMGGLCRRQIWQHHSDKK